MTEENNFEKYLPGCINNQSLARITTMKVGGAAKYLYLAKDLNSLKNAITLAKKRDMDYLVIGGGSNIIFSDWGFNGLIIKNQASSIIVGNQEVVADSGIYLNVLIRKLAENNLGNLEFLVGIPGTLGGAVFGNAGAFGKCMADIVKSVLIMNSEGKIYSFSNEKMEFGYRDSFLKRHFKNQQKNPPTILSVNLKVTPRQKEMILRTNQNYMRIRAGKQPNSPSAGSFFKNINIDDYPDFSNEAELPIIDGKIPTGALLERIGAKSMHVGGAYVFSKHANWIINKNGRAKAYEIKQLAIDLKQKVRAKFGVEIHEEVIYVGDFNQPPKNLFEKLFKL